MRPNPGSSLREANSSFETIGRLKRSEGETLGREVGQGRILKGSGSLVEQRVTRHFRSGTIYVSVGKDK
jgi:hypothetical protein